MLRKLDRHEDCAGGARRKMAHIIVEKGPERGRTIEVKTGARLVFGRDEACDIVTADVSCSRRHFGVAEKDGRFIIKDLNSTHGTTLNGHRVDQHELADGDTIVAGESVLSFNIEKEVNRGLIGKTIAGYQIIERLGRGGMGTVYRAKQVALDRDVALKVLSARYSNDKVFINRFFKEAQAAARLNNPNVVQVYDVREEKGLYLISLEMMGGGTVQDLASREGQLAIKRVLEIARDAAKGLVYAEKKGIVHGDIKPDNLMMNSEAQVKISDLGLARDAGEVAHQGEEGIFGTPHFISPEQAQGKQVDTRSDIYSLGATLYRLLAGSTPFSGNSVREIIMKQIQEEPPDLRGLRPDCPQDLADLVAVMMAKAAEERFETAEALLAAIEALGEEGKLQTAKSAGLKIGLIVMVLALVGGAGWWFSRDEPKPIKPKEPESVGPATLSPEEIAQRERIARQERELAVKALVIAADNERIGLERDGKLGELAELERLHGLYEAAVASDPETEAADGARAKKAEIQGLIDKRRQEIAAEEAEREARRQAADSVWDALGKEVQALVSAGRHGAAIQIADRRRAELADTQHEGDLQDLRDRLVKGVEDAAAQVEKSAQAALDRKEFAGARTEIESFLEPLAEGTEDQAALDLVAPLSSRLQALVGRIDGAEKEAREQDRKLDQKNVFATLHAYYRDFGKSFEPEKARQALVKLRGMLQTGHFVTRIDEMEKRLDHVDALKQALAKAVANPEKEVTTSAGARDLPAGRVVEVNADGFVVERRSGSRQEIEFAKVDAALLHDKLFKRLDLDLRGRKDQAWWLIESGLYEEAVEIVDALKEDAGSDPELVDLDHQVREELAAKAVLDQAREAYAKADGGQDASAWFRVDRLLGILLDKHRSSRVFLINSDGSSGLE
ncbi:MAG: protein kinase [Planctomycetes bacterium]|nr:protein kinase [Planctomycetota bacterium]